MMGAQPGAGRQKWDELEELGNSQVIKNIPSPGEWFEFNSMHNVKLPG